MRRKMKISVPISEKSERYTVTLDVSYVTLEQLQDFSSFHQLAIKSRAETNTSSTRLPGSLKYPNYPIAGIRIR